MTDAMLTVEPVNKSFPVSHGLGAMFRSRSWQTMPRRHGAGKSTLVKLLSTLTVADRDRMTLDGVDGMLWMY